MTKRYVADHGFHVPFNLGHAVYVEQNGARAPLTHHVYHSPDGHAWGYGGSGPSELAKDILWDLLGEQPEPSLYHAFKDEFIATLPQDTGFTIGEAEIRAWLATLAPVHR